MTRALGIILTLSALLSACAVFPTAATYQPVIVRVDDQVQWAKDQAECHKVADPYSPGVSPGSIAQSAVTGAASNAAYGVINPLVPAAGAIGGAAAAAINGFDLMGQASVRVFVRCLEEETRRDHSALLADPNG